MNRRRHSCARSTAGYGRRRRCAWQRRDPASQWLITASPTRPIDCCPVVSLGGSSPISQFGRQVFQVDRRSRADARLQQARRSSAQPEAHSQQDQSSRCRSLLPAGRCPSYVDRPGDLLYTKIDADPGRSGAMLDGRLWIRVHGDPRQVNALVQALAEAKQPLIVSGSGRDLVGAGGEMRHSSRLPAFRSTPPRKAAAWCRTIIRARTCRCVRNRHSAMPDIISCSARG